jgi:hypothetical protein
MFPPADPTRGLHKFDPFYPTCQRVWESAMFATWMLYTWDILAVHARDPTSSNLEVIEEFFGQLWIVPDSPTSPPP